jgi:hypothetical protein
MLTSLGNLFRDWLPRSQVTARLSLTGDPPQPLQPIGFGDFLNLNVPPREMLLDPILPERSLAMLYAPRGVGKTLLGLSIGLAVSSGTTLLRWSAPRKQRVLYVDGEMPLVSLQERLRMLSVGLGSEIPNHGFQVLAADHTDNGISLGTDEGQDLLQPLLNGVDLLVLDNLSTLVTTGSENASDGWVAMQNWLLRLRRQGVAVLLIHHAARTVASEERHVGKMPWIQSSRYGDRKIIRLNRGSGSKYIARSCGIGLMAMRLFHSRRGSKRRMEATEFDGWQRT